MTTTTSSENTPIYTAGIDVGSGAVKGVVMGFQDGKEELVTHTSARIRKRDIKDVVNDVFQNMMDSARVPALHYIASTGDGEDIAFATGHFYGMTTHARGALFLNPNARSVLDVGALHARAVAMDGKGRVENYKMTSQCASGSGQFLENISRYLGVSQSEIGALSLASQKPEKVSSICAVLAETDVINMVSRGISTPDILRGLHESMAGRFARLLRALNVSGVTFVSGGLAGDEGLMGALGDALAQGGRLAGPPVEISVHPLSIFAGALGAAIWGHFRFHKLGLNDVVWTRADPQVAA